MVSYDAVFLRIVDILPGENLCLHVAKSGSHESTTNKTAKYFLCIVSNHINQ